eukprot:TRINITY_DN967_c0_g1_i2.p1 TRINITY_DN967_c0_g1~~TRINITY_DN967_c0_g1_i2.p1  ORF type:complete len:132 (-),score=63.88 TRINITY_DN967_c0_g1_i2:113-508(-)
MANSVLYYGLISKAVYPKPAPKVEKKEEVEEEAVVEETKEQTPAQTPAETPKEAAKDDDDVDLFGDDDEEDEEWEKIRAQRAKELEEKRAAEGKTKPIPKSAVILDVKPIDDETNMGELEKHVRSIVMEGM